MTPALAQSLAAEVRAARLVLQPLTAGHADVFFPHLQDERLYTWISMTPPASVEALRQQWRRIETRRSPDGRRAWPTWAVSRLDDQRVVGRVDAEVDDRMRGVLGYYIFPSYWGSGYASEAAAAAADALFARGVRRLRATVTAGHLASERVLLKAGFRFVRVLPGHDTIRGEPVDDHEYVRASAQRQDVT